MSTTKLAEALCKAKDKQKLKEEIQRHREAMAKEMDTNKRKLLATQVESKVREYREE